eukprot:scaffold161438_cov13-Tisochrysis_lutea.AAC.1
MLPKGPHWFKDGVIPHANPSTCIVVPAFFTCIVVPAFFTCSFNLPYVRPHSNNCAGAMPGAVGLSTCIDKSKRPSSIRFHRRPTLEKHRTIGSHVNPLY